MRERAPGGVGGDERSRQDCHRVGVQGRVSACRHAPWGSVVGGPNGDDLQPRRDITVGIQFYPCLVAATDMGESVRDDLRVCGHKQSIN